jgi:hypothetical protein
MDFVPYNVIIDWDSAEVIPKKDTLELRVRLANEPTDNHWRSAFDELGQSHAGQIGRLPAGTWVNSPTGSYVTAGGIEPGTEDAVREGLDELVDAVNIRAGQIKAEWDERTGFRADQEEALRHAADDATQRFRSGD